MTAAIGLPIAALFLRTANAVILLQVLQFFVKFLWNACRIVLLMPTQERDALCSWSAFRYRGLFEARNSAEMPNGSTSSAQIARDVLSIRGE
jgi:hypothetical protein